MDIEKILEAIRKQTEETLKKMEDPEYRRKWAEDQRKLFQEIEDGWLGISDFMSECSRKNSGNQ